MEGYSGRDLLAEINHRATRLAVGAERAFLHALGGGCSAPVAALASLEGDLLHLHGRVLSLDGSEVVDIEVVGRCPDLAAATDIGEGLAEQAIHSGAGQILEAIA
jgi:hydroxymethylbilane synthase